LKGGVGGDGWGAKVQVVLARTVVRFQADLQLDQSLRGQRVPEDTAIDDPVFDEVVPRQAGLIPISTQ
jgi:hypothetical protein